VKREHPLSKKADAFNAKLAPKYSGSYEVKNIVSPVIVDIRSKRGKWYRHVYIQDLKTGHMGNNNQTRDDLIPPTEADDETDEDSETTVDD